MNSTVSPFYLDGQYAALNPQFGDDHAEHKAGLVMDMLGRLSLTPATVCEVGCGGGGILLHLKKKLPEGTVFTGYEPMPEAFAVCRSREEHNVQFFNTSPAGLKLEQPYDVVLCLDVFEHVEDYLGFLRSLKGLGRTFIFNIPLDMNVQMVLRAEPIARVRREVGHIHYFSKDTALATLKDAGYKVADWFYSDSSKSKCNDRPLKSRLLTWPRRFLHRLAPDFAVRLLGGFPLMVAATPDEPVKP